MEAATQTNQNHRELTPSEIKIAIAQIEDRLMRVAKAQKELSKLSDKLSLALEEMESTEPECIAFRESEDEMALAEKEIELREKYEIPQSVFLFEQGMDVSAAGDCKKHISAFVRGKLTENEFLYLQYFFEDVAEADWGLILLEQPFYYYSQPPEEFSHERLMEELRATGTRSRAKRSNLPRLYGRIIIPENFL